MSTISFVIILTLTFEKVNFPVAAPHQGGVHVVRDAGEPVGYVFRIPVVHRRASVPPVFGFLEEVRLAVLVRERRVDGTGQAGPRAGYGLWKALGEPVIRQLPVVIA